MNKDEAARLRIEKDEFEELYEDYIALDGDDDE